ncbi:nuclease [Litorimonas cladophorae]|uniref:Nuclease n=1 Tax=Litorimonas cladophorae TaxID=1220491 RepID=A0A918KH46_9PROT|nr:thermonuclease family protein [Litorimonas cladophorae]GGX63571.1 nuclease [Litorimonas cladophorae]
MTSEADTNILLSRRTALITGTASLFLMGKSKSPSVPSLSKGEIGQVARIVDGDSFVMRLSDESELSVRLSAVQAPRTAQRAQKAWPYAKEAKAGLAAIIQGRRVQLFYGGENRDRFGRAVAQVHTLDGRGVPDLWVQGELVRLGLVRVYSWKGELADMEALYGFENQARDRSRGLWADPTYAVRKPDPDPLAQDVDSWQIIEGVVTSTADVRGRIYLNFGADYRTDFTVAIAKKNVKRFDEIKPVELSGARVRVRGWIEMINGPMIWLDHPGRLEVLS